MAVYENKGTIEPTYIVTKEPDGSGNYVCPAASTSDEDYINQAINDLTTGRFNKEVVELKGEFIIDSPILIDSHVWLRGPARIYQADDPDFNMIEMIRTAAPRVINWEISHLILDCDRAEHATGHGIFYESNDTCLAQDGLKKIHDIWFRNVKEDGLHLETGAGDNVMNFAFYNSEFYQVENYDIYLDKVHDSYFHMLRTNGEVYLYNCSRLFWSKLYQAGGSNPDNINIYINGGSRLHFKEVSIDSGQAGCLNALRLNGVNDSIFEDWEIRSDGAALPANLAAVSVRGTSTHNQFTDFLVYENRTEAYAKWDHAIEENASADNYNTYKGINGEDCAVNALELQGLNGMVDFHTIQGAINAPDAFVNAHPVELFHEYVGGGAAEAAFGVLINGAGHTATWLGQVPPWVTQGCRVEAWARTVVTEADQMLCDFTVDGAADNEASNTHTVALNAQQSVTTNFTAGDIIHWSLTDNVINDISGGDSVRVVPLYRVVGAPDIDTQAAFRRIILYVV